MRKILPVLVFLWGASAWAATAPVHLRAVLVMGADKYYSLSTETGDHQQWVTVGDDFEGYKVVRYDETAKALLITKDGQETSLQLAGERIEEAPAKATLAQAEEVLRKMQFEKMMERVIEQQKQSVIGMVRQMFARSGNAGVSADDMAAFQAKVMDVMWAEMKPADMAKDVAQIYSEVFTADELAGLSDFYSTPAGQAMVTKQPEVQQKMMQVMMPRMMAAMPKIQTMAREFAAAEAAKRQAQEAPAGAPPAPTPAPESGTGQ